MPEGDTVHAVARALSAGVLGKTVDHMELHDRGVVRELSGKRIERIEAVGKHLLLHIESGWTLRVHLGMKGSWRKLHAREPRPARATVALVVGDVAYVCIGAYRAELMPTATARHHPRLARLGPDLLDEPPHIDEAVERALLPAHAGREIADLLLDQRVASGIGNIYKSEVLFDRGIHPRTRVGSLDRATLHDLFSAAARLMHTNLATRAGARRVSVYGRVGRPCKRCRAPIQRFVQGDVARSTYFCARCQAAKPCPRNTRPHVP